MITVWWSQAKLIHYEFIPAGETITENINCTQIEEMHKKLAVMCPAMVNWKTPFCYIITLGHMSHNKP